MKETTNLGRVINLPGCSLLWKEISEILFQHLLGHFFTGFSEWKETAINQLERVLVNEEKIFGVKSSKLYELSDQERLLQELAERLGFLWHSLYGSYDYVSFEYAHKHLHSMEWSDVDGEFVDKYDYRNAVFCVLNASVVPAVQKWMEEVKASDPQWTNGEDWFNYPVFTWDEEKQETIFTSVKFISPFVLE